MTNEMRTNGVKARFEERTNTKKRSAKNESLQRI